MIEGLLRFLWYKSKAANKRIWRISHEHLFGSIGKNVLINLPCDFTYKNIYLADGVIIDKNATIWCADSRVFLGYKSGLGPNVTIIAGNHNMSTVGKYFLDVTNKLPGDDEDVHIEEDVFVGANVIILKGVTIGRGAIIGAGSVVIKSIPPYAIAVGNPAKVVKYRFTPEEIEKHEKILYKQS